MKQLFFILVVVLTAKWVEANPTFRGESDEAWNFSGYSIVVAKVKAVEHAADGTWRSTLRPMATIAGKFDPSEHLELRVSSFGPGGSVRKVPIAGDFVLTALAFSENAAPDKGWVIPIVYMAFMAGGQGAALVIIDGPGDPAIQETLTRIQEARVKGREKAEGDRSKPAESTTRRATTTRPTTAPR